jgi:AcrR family transcriptional regulator
MQARVRGQSRARLSRVDRKALTRERLIESGHAVFIRRGFHAATLEEIAMEAGVTKGAVYSNFEGKADLFIAVVEARTEQRMQGYRRAYREAKDIEALARQHARIMVKDDPNGRWSSVLTSAWAETADDPDLRKKLLDIQVRATSFIGQTIKETADRTGVEFPYPIERLNRMGGALMRGLLLQRLLDPKHLTDQEIEDAFVAFVRGMGRPARGGNTDGEQ